MSPATRITLLLTLAVASTLPLFAQAPAGAPAAAPAGPMPDVGGPTAVWRDKSRTPDQRARDLLPRLTLQEKIGLMHADGTFTSAGLPRFGIGKMWMSDGPAGVREEIQPTSWNSAGHTDDFATAMPADVGLAASFDTDLGKAFGNVIGEEAFTRKKNIMLCPGLNIMRTPLNGRNSEYLGEDPFLAARMAVGFITGLQQNGVSACAKHYAFNNQEANRGSVNVKVDERTMREIYLPAFKAAVTEAHTWAVMTAYNRVNGQYCSENAFLINQVLKSDWGFQGLVMTDWSGCHSTIDAANNGLDLEMGSNVTGNHNNDFLANPLLAIMTGPDPKVPMSRIDDAALRNLRVMIATGLADPPRVLTDEEKTRMAMLSPAHVATAQKVVESACVLLKNANNVLPIDPAKTKTIAVFGDIAQALFARDGNSATIKTRNEVSVLAGIQARAGSGIKVNFVQGYAGAGRGGRGGARGLGGAVNADPATAPGGAAPSLIDAAVAAAKQADVAIVVAGLYRSQDQEGRDRSDMNLPQAQVELLQAVTKANPKTLVIMTGGSPSNVNPWISDAAGLMMYWYGGTTGGTGLARVLFGDVSPSGHLPCTWPKQLADSPAHAPNDPSIFPGVNGAGGARGGGGGRGGMTADSGPQETYAEGVFVGYRWYDAKKIEPQFPFGFGLSYTTFAYSGATIAPEGGVPTVSFTVANTGSRDGATAAQVYVSQVSPTVERPPQELKGFQKVMLKAGAQQVVKIALPMASFTHYDVAKHAWVGEAGDYTILVGDSSRNLPLKATYKLAEAVTIKEGQ